VIRGGSGKIRPVFFITPMIGTKLAHYEITSQLGSGGMGEVYQAMDSKLGRSVAVKFLSEAFARDADRLIRFEREARVRGEFPPRPQLVFDIARDNASAIDTISDRRSWIRFGTETRTC
jgi:serine/threonine protein kinase